MKKLPFGSIIGATLAGAGMTVSAGAATVPYPYIDIVQQGGDAGVNATGSTPTVTMQGTAISIINGPGNSTSLAPTATFTLSATYSAALTVADGQPNTYDYTNGVITIGNGGSAPLLTATFSDLVMQSAGTSLFNYVIASTPLTYTGGSLAGSLSGGEIVGSFTVTGANAYTSSGAANLSQDYAGNNLTAKVGAVVPLPASAWLLISGIGGLGALFSRLGPPAACARGTRRRARSETLAPG
jgi:hypothetical protein